MTTPISSSYAAATETQFVAGQKFMYSHDYVILDGAGKLRFELKRKSGVICAKDKRRLIDVATGQVVLLIVYDTPLVGRSWLTAYLGDSQKDSQELLHFRKKTTLRKSSTYEAFLAGNRDPLKPDFYIQKRLKWDVGFTILSQSGIIAEVTFDRPKASSPIS